MKKNIYIIFFSIVLLIMGCSDKNPTSPGGDSNNQTPKALSMKKIPVPSGMKGTFEQHVLSARTSIDIANSFYGNLSAYVNPPMSKLSKKYSVNGKWTRTWKLANGISVIMEYSENSSTFGWIIYLDGNNGSTTYSKSKYLEAQETIASKNGKFSIFFPGSENTWASIIINYFNEQNGTYKVNILVNDTNVNQPIEEHLVTVKEDNSGNVELYSYDTGSKKLKQKTTWTSTGSGKWTVYDNSGNIVKEGSF